MTRLLSIALFAATLSAQTYDGNGALEAFYTRHECLAEKIHKCYCGDRCKGYCFRGMSSLWQCLPRDEDLGTLKHHWYASKRFWVPVAAIGAGFAIGVAVNSMRSGVSTYHPSSTMQPSAPVPQQPGILDVTHIGIGGPGIPVVIVHGIN